MKVAAVISEFNPFHNGHKYLVDKIKSEYADCVVAIMSGNFVQRGDIAITDKFERAQAALDNGCDLVVELPTTFALSSAQRFAQGGVAIANALGADILCFGAENDDISLLCKVADAFDDETFNENLKELLNNGEYYPKAVSLSMEKTFGKNFSDILSTANNTLAIEYIKALKGTKLSPVAIKREGAQHDCEETSSNIASATHIRNLIREGKDCSSFTNMKIEDFTDIKKLETVILYRLRTMTPDELSNLPDVSEGLHNRIADCANSSNSLEELFDKLKTKRYTLARLRRTVMYALLNITKDDMKMKVSYIRVLGMNNNGAKLLKNASLPLICKYPQDVKALSNKAQKQFSIDLKAGKVFSLCRKEPYNELKKRIIKV